MRNSLARQGAGEYSFLMIESVIPGVGKAVLSVTRLRPRWEIPSPLFPGHYASGLRLAPAAQAEPAH
jgi:hypothetical protein